VALIDNRPIDARAFRAMLQEAAGALVFEEMVLDHELDAALREAGVSVTASMVEQERRRMAEALVGVTGVAESESERLIERVRATRGLGPERFARLLSRNAGLRALAQRSDGAALSSVTREQLEQAYAIRYGERVRSRLILVGSEADAARVLRRVRPGEGQPGESFADVAVAESIDPTASRGGLLDPISPEDPSYPVAFRRALSSLAPNAISDAIPVTWPSAPGRPPSQGVAVVQVVERLPGTGPGLSAVASRLESEIRMVRERAAMDRIARELTAQGLRRATVLDESLEWSRTASTTE